MPGEKRWASCDYASRFSPTLSTISKENSIALALIDSIKVGGRERLLTRFQRV